MPTFPDLNFFYFVVSNPSLGTLLPLSFVSFLAVKLFTTVGFVLEETAFFGRMGLTYFNTFVVFFTAGFLEMTLFLIADLVIVLDLPPDIF